MRLEDASGRVEGEPQANLCASSSSAMMSGNSGFWTPAIGKKVEDVVVAKLDRMTEQLR